MLVPLMKATFMLPMTPRPHPMTTRKTVRAPWRARAGAAVLSAVALGGGGCATPGTLHVYTVDHEKPATVARRPWRTTPLEVPSFIKEGERLTGFAYDPFTDHFFLRLAPGDRMRVVDRPARAVKREFAIGTDPASRGGDMAVRPARRAHLPGEFNGTGIARNHPARKNRPDNSPRHADRRAKRRRVMIRRSITCLCSSTVASGKISIHDLNGHRLGVVTLGASGRPLRWPSIRSGANSMSRSSPIRP